MATHDARYPDYTCIFCLHMSCATEGFNYPRGHTFDTALGGGTIKDGVEIRVEQRFLRRNGKGAEGLDGSGQPL